MAELLEQFELTQARAPADEYLSPAACRRLVDLAASLAGRPSVLFLDEPSTGLDPQSRAMHPAGRRRAGRLGRARCSSPRSTWRRPTSWPAGSRCWPGAA